MDIKEAISNNKKDLRSVREDMFKTAIEFINKFGEKEENGDMCVSLGEYFSNTKDAKMKHMDINAEHIVLRANKSEITVFYNDGFYYPVGMLDIEDLINVIEKNMKYRENVEKNSKDTVFGKMNIKIKKIKSMLDDLNTDIYNFIKDKGKWDSYKYVYKFDRNFVEERNTTRVIYGVNATILGFIAYKASEGKEETLIYAETYEGSIYMNDNNLKDVVRLILTHEEYLKTKNKEDGK